MEIVELIDSIKNEMDNEIDRLREEVKNLSERVNLKSIEEEKIPEWKRLEWCCENLYKSTLEEYSTDGGYPQNPSILQGDDNSLFVGHVEDRITFCPWCGMKLNNE
jgi:hypothetical protein